MSSLTYLQWDSQILNSFGQKCIKTIEEANYTDERTVQQPQTSQTHQHMTSTTASHQQIKSKLIIYKIIELLDD